MQNDKIYSDILRQIRTKSDADELLAELDGLSESIYKTDPAALEATLSTFRSSHAAFIRAALAGGIDKLTLIKELGAQVAALKPVSLALAFEPTEEFAERLHEWLIQNVGEGVVLDFEVKPEIIAGAIISYNGRYLDFSLSNFLKTYGQF